MQDLSHDSRLLKYNIVPYILKAVDSILSEWFWGKRRPPRAGLGFVVAQIAKLFYDDEIIKDLSDAKALSDADSDKKMKRQYISVYAFNPGICTVLAETIAFYNDIRGEKAPPLIIRGFNIYINSIYLHYTNLYCNTTRYRYERYHAL